MGELVSHPLIPSHSQVAAVCSKGDIASIASSVTHIIVSSNCANDASLFLLDFSRFVSVRRIIVGDESLMYVNEMKMIGLSGLESVEIRKNSFTKYMNTWEITSDPNRHFYLKNCPKLKSLKMGRYSFSDYSVCEIENVDALEVIEMGDVNEESYNFLYASLELKSILIHNE